MKPSNDLRLACSIDGCTRVLAQRGWCTTHYKRWWTHGDTSIVLPRGGRKSGAKNVVQAKPACHPDQPHYAAGLCQSCYTSRRYKNNPERYKSLARKWLADNPGRSRIHRRRAGLKKLGATIEQYESLWTAQGGRCANPACSFEAPLAMADYRQGLQVDHDHKTGAIRKLLCPRCNTALGHVDDSAELLRGLATYIEALN